MTPVAVLNLTLGSKYHWILGLHFLVSEYRPINLVSSSHYFRCVLNMPPSMVQICLLYM